MFLTIEHVLRITDFCICMYVFGCRLRLFRLCDSDFGISPVDDIINGVTLAVFCFHTAHISSPVLGICFVYRLLCWRDYVYLGQLCLSKRCYLFSY
jgi:hypothetical protein